MEAGTVAVERANGSTAAMVDEIDAMARLDIAESRVAPLRTGATRSERIRRAQEVSAVAEGIPASDYMLQRRRYEIEHGLAGEDIREDADWGPLVPLDHAAALPAFPAHVLPGWLRAMVNSLAAALQVPLELPAMFALALVSGVIAGKYRVIVRPSWVMPPVLYVLTMLPPSERKSPVIQELSAPLRDWEREQNQVIAEARREALVRVDQARVRTEAALKAITNPKKGDGDDTQRAERHRAAARELADAEAAVPPEARLLVEFATEEALAERMADRDGRQIILSDEGGGVFRMATRYSRGGGADLDVLLKGSDGAPYTPARLTRRARPIEAATLTIALAAQPAAVLEALRATPEIRDRGLFARFLALMPPPRVGYRLTRPPPVSEPVAEAYRATMTALLNVPDIFDDAGRLAPRPLRFSKGADDVLEAFENELEPGMRRGGRFERIGAAIGKLAGTTARVAANLHVARYAGGPIPEAIAAETVTNAVTIAKAIIPHLEAFEDALAAPPELEGARRIAEWLRRNGRPNVTEREILRGTRGAAVLATAEQRDGALRLLERHGYVRRPASDGPAQPGRPSRTWDVRPGWLTSATANLQALADTEVFE